MKEINLAKNLIELRKKKGVTQEELAKELHISSQAVSKWETGICLPDIVTLPLIAEYYNVSIDYLFYGLDLSYGDINDRVYNRIYHFDQMSKESFSEAINIYSCLHAGIARMDNILKSNENPNHISCENGLSLFSSDGYGCLITRDYFTNIDVDSLDLCKDIFEVLTKENTLLVISNIIEMSDISYNELIEKTRLEDEKLKEAILKLKDNEIIIETKSKHKSLEFTYDINDMYYIPLCIMLATSNVLLQGIKKGISCHLGFGDFPIKLSKSIKSDS